MCTFQITILLLMPFARLYRRRGGLHLRRLNSPTVTNFQENMQMEHFKLTLSIPRLRPWDPSFRASRRILKGTLQGRQSFCPRLSCLRHLYPFFFFRLFLTVGDVLSELPGSYLWMVPSVSRCRIMTLCRAFVSSTRSPFSSETSANPRSQPSFSVMESGFSGEIPLADLTQ